MAVVDKRVSTCWVLQQVLGVENVRFDPAAGLRIFVGPVTAADVREVRRDAAASLSFAASYSSDRKTRLVSRAMARAVGLAVIWCGGAASLVGSRVFESFWLQARSNHRSSDGPMRPEWPLPSRRLPGVRCVRCRCDRGFGLSGPCRCRSLATLGAVGCGGVTAPRQGPGHGVGLSGDTGGTGDRHLAEPATGRPANGEGKRTVRRRLKPRSGH